MTSSTTELPAADVSIGWLVPPDVFALDHDRRLDLLDRAARSDIGHLAVGDHVSFIDGTGFDGLVHATTLLAQQRHLPVTVAVYLLALRHPVVVARSLASIAEMAPGRLRLGVGVGGEDRHEVSSCGVDPAVRGRRTDESLAVVRRLLTGTPVDHHGEHFDLEAVSILPPADPPVPLLIGGRSDAAIQRAARSGDGWLAIWVSPERFARETSRIEELALDLGRVTTPNQHALNLWSAVGDTPAEARHYLAPAMEGLYATPFERFARYSPHGTAEHVASTVLDYVAAGSRSFNLIMPHPDHRAAVDAIAEVAGIVGRSLDRAAGATSARSLAGAS